MSKATATSGLYPNTIAIWTAMGNKRRHGFKVPPSLFEGEHLFILGDKSRNSAQL
jgi:hypothetical protein